MTKTFRWGERHERKIPEIPEKTAQMPADPAGDRTGLFLHVYGVCAPERDPRGNQRGTDAGSHEGPLLPQKKEITPKKPGEGWTPTSPGFCMQSLR